MPYCTQNYNGVAPSPVATINLNTTVLQLSDSEGFVTTYNDESFSGTELVLPYTPLPGYQMQVFVNGLLQAKEEHYTISGKTITFLNTLTTDAVSVHYASLEATVAPGTDVVRLLGVYTGSTVTLPATPGSSFPVTVYVNGVLQRLTTDYTISGAVITFVTPLASDTVQVLYSA